MVLTEAKKKKKKGGVKRNKDQLSDKITIFLGAETSVNV